MRCYYKSTQHWKPCSLSFEWTSRSLFKLILQVGLNWTPSHYRSILHRLLHHQVLKMVHKTTYQCIFRDAFLWNRVDWPRPCKWHKTILKTGNGSFKSSQDKTSGSSLPAAGSVWMENSPILDLSWPGSSTNMQECSWWLLWALCPYKAL